MSESKSRAVSPEDILSDDQSLASLGGAEVRKGSVAAFVANAKILESLDPADADYPAVEAQLRALVPAVRAAGVFDVLSPRTAVIAALVDDE